MLLTIKKFKLEKKIIAYCIFFFLFIFLFIKTDVYSSEDNSVISTGNKDAKITVKVFSSLTCPHCANFHNKVFYKLKKEFIEKNVVRFEQHSFPLDLAALNAEKILRCSNNTKKRLDFLSELYEKQDVWATGPDINNINSKLIRIGKNYGLNDDRVKACLKDEKLEDKILSDRINGNKKYSITSTPTIIINEKKYEGEHNYESFKKAIKKFL